MSNSLGKQSMNSSSVSVDNFLNKNITVNQKYSKIQESIDVFFARNKLLVMYSKPYQAKQPEKH